MNATVNVILVGGGAAGLSAAVAIGAEGLTCQLLEAQPRLGGRVQTVSQDETGAVDRGAQMVNGDMSAVLDLARSAGLDCAPVPRSGRDLCVMGEEVLSRTDLISDDEIYALLDAQVVRWDSLRAIPQVLWKKYQWWTTPWEDLGEAGRGLKHAVIKNDAPKASLARALGDMLLCAEDHAVAYSMFCELCGAAPEVLDADATRTAFASYASERDDLEFQFPAGMGRIIDALAARLQHTPRLNTAVTEIRVGQGAVEVVTEKGAWRAAQVVVAVPPPVARRITFEV